MYNSPGWLVCCESPQHVCTYSSGLLLNQSINIYYNVLGGNWDPTDKKFSSVNALLSVEHVCTCSPGWLVHWGEKMANTSAKVLTDSFSEILAYGQGSGSVNFYMAHGGTNFGWTAGGCPVLVANTFIIEPAPLQLSCH